MESKEAECILADCAMDSEDENDALVIAVCDAEEAIEAAERDMKKKAIEAWRVMGEETRLDITTDTLIKAKEIFMRELNK